MGVMACSRGNCENIMCDTYVPSVGYICNDCKSEFSEYAKSKGLSTESEIIILLSEFMKLDIDTNNQNTISIETFFQNHTR